MNSIKEEVIKTEEATSKISSNVVTNFRALVIVKDEINVLKTQMATLTRDMKDNNKILKTMMDCILSRLNMMQKKMEEERQRQDAEEIRKKLEETTALLEKLTIEGKKTMETTRNDEEEEQLVLHAPRCDPLLLEHEDGELDTDEESFEVLTSKTTMKRDLKQADQDARKMRKRLEETGARKKFLGRGQLIKRRGYTDF